MCVKVNRTWAINHRGLQESHNHPLSLEASSRFVHKRTGHTEDVRLAIAIDAQTETLEIARFVGYAKENQIQQLRRYVKYVLKTEYGPEAATAAEESAAALINETAEMLAETPAAPIGDVNIPSPNDWGRVMAVYTFPELLSPRDEKMTCDKCKTQGCPSDHDPGPFFEMFGYITCAKFALHIHQAKIYF